MYSSSYNSTFYNYIKIRALNELRGFDCDAFEHLNNFYCASHFGIYITGQPIKWVNGIIKLDENGNIDSSIFNDFYWISNYGHKYYYYCPKTYYIPTTSKIYCIGRSINSPSHIFSYDLNLENINATFYKVCKQNSCDYPYTTELIVKKNDKIYIFSNRYNDSSYKFIFEFDGSLRLISKFRINVNTIYDMDMDDQGKIYISFYTTSMKIYHVFKFDGDSVVLRKIINFPYTAYSFNFKVVGDGLIFSWNYDNYDGFYLLKTDFDLNIIWQKKYQIPDIDGSLKDIFIDNDGNYLLIFNSKFFSGFLKGTFLKIDNDGNLLGIPTFFAPAAWTSIENFFKTNDGRFFVHAGYQYTNILSKINQNLIYSIDQNNDCPYGTSFYADVSSLDVSEVSIENDSLSPQQNDYTLEFADDTYFYESFDIDELLSCSHTTEPLSIDINLSTSSGCLPLTVNFTTNVNGGYKPYTYFWDFKDGGTSNQPNPQYIFQNPGIYDVTLTVTDSDNPPNSVTDKIRVAVLDCQTQNIIVLPIYAPEGPYNPNYSQGTTEGGTLVDIFSAQNSFENNALVYFDFSNSCPQNTNTQVPVESVEFIDSSHLKIKTPRGYEGAVSVFIDNPNLPDICQTNAYTYKTLAFTANQVTQDISVVDTKDNKIFEGKGQIPFSSGITPLGISYSKRINEIGRKIYITDFHGGDLHIYDGSNLEYLSKIKLQEWDGPPLWLTASDVSIDYSGNYAYVTHMTAGTMPSPMTSNPDPGGVSVVDLINDKVIDVDANPNTTSEGAPEGITRIHKYISNEPMKFYPMGIEVVRLEKGQDDFIANEKYPGEYAFASGVGEVLLWYGEVDPCPVGYICDPPWVIIPRPVIVEVIDLNPYKVVTPCSDQNCNDFTTETNPDYWKVIKVFETGKDGFNLRFTNQGIGYIGAEPRHEIYAVNRYQGGVVRFGYEWTGDPANPLDWQIIDEPPIPTGTNPTDVKVQRVPDIYNPGNYYIYAYITNAGDDSVTVIDTGTNTEIPSSPIYQDLQCTELDHYPTSFDTRNVGDFGYSSDFYSNTVSIFNLPYNSMPQYPNPCKIDVGGAPIKIAVQPVPTADDIFGIVKDALSFSSPNDFTTPSKQSNLIRDWENVHKLQETQANPQAVLSNIDNFKKNANKWIKNEELKKKINENVDLYRAGYILDNPGIK